MNHQLATGQQMQKILCLIKINVTIWHKILKFETMELYGTASSQNISKYSRFPVHLQFYAKIIFFKKSAFAMLDACCSLFAWANGRMVENFKLNFESRKRSSLNRIFLKIINEFV